MSVSVPICVRMVLITVVTLAGIMSTWVLMARFVMVDFWVEIRVIVEVSTLGCVSWDLWREMDTYDTAGVAV